MIVRKFLKGCGGTFFKKSPHISRPILFSSVIIEITLDPDDGRALITGAGG